MPAQVIQKNFWAQIKQFFLSPLGVNPRMEPQVYVGESLLGGAAKATGVLTSDATAPSNNDTVTIGSRVYTYKTTLTGAANEVLIGASAAAALDNLKSAINGTAGAGTTYGTGTVAHPSVTATTNTDTAQTVEALVAGVQGNQIASTEASTHLSWGATKLTGGTGTTDAITKAGFAVITTVGANLPTLFTPVAGTDDGKVLIVISTTAWAHIITATTNKIAGGGATALGNTLTFAAKEGAGVTLIAYNGLWYVRSLVNVTLSAV